MNMIIIGLFLPVIGTLFSDELSLEKVFNNPYTQVGLLVWWLSTTFLVITYLRARNAASDQLDPIEKRILGEIPADEQLYHIQDKVSDYAESLDNINRFITWCMWLSLIATTLLALGVLLPYVSVIPQIGVFLIILGIVGAGVILGILFLITGRVRRWLERYRSDEKGWEELTKPRQELFKKLYVAVGEENFQLSELPLKHGKPIQSGTLGSSELDESHVLLQDVNDTKISKYLLERLVEEQYFEKKGDLDEVVLKDPYTYDEVRIDEADQTIKTVLDRFGRELEHKVSARECAASELEVRPEKLFDELRSGSKIERIERYNRVVERLQEEIFDVSIRKFEFVSDEVTYVPTDLAKNVYETIHRMEESRIHEREQAEQEEKIRKEENTYLFLVIEPVDEMGNIAVATNGLRAPKGEEQRFNISEAKVSEEEREQLKNLEVDDQVRLRIETHPKTHEDYIASVGGP
ncbi:hypothetical protein [Natrinema sp. HArc-T2]|uniref:hypothetical protein n=1 Tax=Natrinema sp. HArc-T2 TaxID=3242701 RepID=UPI00359E1505